MMRNVDYLLPIFLVFLFSSETLAFLEHPDPVVTEMSVIDTGHCVWYGENGCGPGYNQGKLNCPANSTTRIPPKLIDPDGLRILKSYCPNLYHGDDNTYTCCSGDQLRTFQQNLALPEQLLSRCPACFFNFLNSICQTTCSPLQSKFVRQDPKYPKPDPSSTGIGGIDVVLTDKYMQDLFDSCKDVQMPSANDKALSVFCGRLASRCTPLVWLNYMGNTGNGRAPFTINYIASNTPWHAPNGKILQPFNETNKKCNETVTGSSSKIGTEKCSCKDCAAINCPPPPKPDADTRRKYFDSIFGKDNYSTAEIIVERADSKTPIRHELPPPAVASISFTSLFDKNFLKQVLKLQEDVAGIQAAGQAKTVTLDDICMKYNGECVTESVVQYFQNNKTKIDKEAWDEYKIFLLADYLDHFLSCTRGGIMDVTALNMSCLSQFGNMTLPFIVLQGYDDANYQNATSFVITYILKNTPGQDVQAWENAFEKYMNSYSNPNMTLTFTPHEEAFLEHPDPVVTERPVADTGHCVWYGENGCGPGYNQGKLNCPANSTTRIPPKLTDPDGLRILKSYCPNLYHGDDNTHTCCSGDQLRTFEQNIILPEELLSRCPACFFNFLNSICQTTCSPLQSKFVRQDPKYLKPDPSSTGIGGIDVVLTDKYMQDLFDSCKDVQMPSFNDKALSVFCGRQASQCTPLVWLNYMGNTGNGRAPFTINYIASNTPWHAPDGKILQPFNETNKKCNEIVTGSSSKIGTEICSCKDCPADDCPPPPPIPKPNADTRKKYFDSIFGKDNYSTAEIIVERVDSKTPVQHQLPPPSIDSISFTSLFDKNFLKQVLKLQEDVAGIQAAGQAKTVTLDDICMKYNGECVTESVVQYFQNNETKIDKEAWDEYKIFILADYLDHFLSCIKWGGIMDVTALRMSCLSQFGNMTLPYIVLQGYDDTNYQNATSFVITYILKNTPGQDVLAWENAFVKYMKSYSNPNMTLTFTPHKEKQNFNQVAAIKPAEQFDAVIPPEDESDPGYSVVMEEEPEEEQGEELEELDGHCVWYGQCGMGWNQGALNCPVTNKTRNSPLLTDPDGLRILKRYCPQLYTGESKTRTCCDLAQLKAVEENLALPDQLLQRCPACYSNFLNQICQMTCSPVQSKFLYANMNASCPSGYPAHGPCVGGGIPSVNYVMTDEYANSLYASCKDVQMPSANDKAMSVFCGRKAKDCSPKIWLSYMGNTGNGRAPFPINYNYTETTIVNPYTEETMYPLNYTNLRCNVTYANISDACSCQDCQSSCAPVPPPPPKEKPFTILGIDGASFIMACIFIAFVIFFGTYVICFSILKKDSLGVGSKESTYTFENGSTAGSQQNLLNRQVSPAEIGTLEKLGLRIEELLKAGFTWWGRLCARYPLIVLLVTIIIFGSLAGGIARYDVTTDPVKLWSSPQSTARTQKAYFDKHFGPFYRTEQLIITRKDKKPVVHPYPPPSVDTITFSSMFDKEFMHQVLDLQTEVEQITAKFDNITVGLEDICFKPLSPDNNNCTIESILQFWQNNHTNLDKVAYDQYKIFVMADYLDHFLKCAQAPASVSDTTPLEMTCLAAYGGPAFPWVVLGGYDALNYQNATAFVITYVVNNHVNEEDNRKAEAWEAEFIKFIKNYKNPNMTISFSSERSIQDELDRESRSDVWTIVLSYLIMFGYITIALGQFHGLSTILIDSKVTLGLSGVTIVLLSVASSVGFYSYCGVPMTLIIIEVVPFLVLAVGVDNIFILVQTYQRDTRKPGEALEDQVGRVLGIVGPSMLLTSFSESIAFFLGAWTDMPAVREFALYAAMAVFFDFVLQVTCFVSLMTIDAKRQEANHFDICCCIGVPKKEKQEKQEGYLYWLVNNYYSHAVLSEWVRPIVMVIFVGWFLASIAFACHLTIGLDQALSMPTDSYVLDYFHNLSAYLSVGAPVYFVVPAGHNYLSTAGQNALCGGKGCPQDSLIGQVFRQSQLSNYSTIAQPASSWIDDYFDWINSAGNPPCCRVHENGTFCPATYTGNCSACPFQPQVSGRPSPHDFMHYLPMFLVDNPGLKCAKGGHAAYGAGVNLIQNKTHVGATYFMTYHTPLKTSGDYILGLKEARKIAKNISKAMGAKTEAEEVFPYSVFYVFYEQYLAIVHNTLKNIGICMAAIFVATFILLGFDFVTAVVVCVTILMIVIDIMGMMYLWDINLNALSLVNLVMAIGISVEFCSHIARAFAVSIQPDRVQRAKDALAHMGSSVLSGITLTKLGGIIVLAFAKSQLFQVFYFRMYLGMVVFGASHGLIFLPVFLSYIGPGINKAKLYQHQQKELKESNRKHHTSESNDAHVNSRERYRHIHSDQPPEYSNAL